MKSIPVFTESRNRSFTDGAYHFEISETHLTATAGNTPQMIELADASEIFLFHPSRLGRFNRVKPPRSPHEAIDFALWLCDFYIKDRTGDGQLVRRVEHMNRKITHPGERYVIVNSGYGIAYAAHPEGDYAGIHAYSGDVFTPSNARDFCDTIAKTGEMHDIWQYYRNSPLFD